MCVSLVLFLLAAGDADSFTKNIESLKSRATAELKRAKEDLSLAKKARVNQAYRGPKKTEKGFVFGDGNEKRSAIAYFESEIQHWEKALNGDVVALPEGDLAIGNIGVITGDENLVVQVVSASAVIIDMNSNERRASRIPRGSAQPRALEAGTQEAFRAFQEARRNADVKPYLQSRLVWIDMSTVGLVDGMKVTITQPVMIIGTRQYETVDGGTKTVMHAIGLSARDLEKYRSLMGGK